MSESQARQIGATMTTGASPLSIAVIIPALNEIDDLPATIEHLRAHDPKPHAVIVADGGSDDGTRELLERLADGEWLHVVDAPRGRGLQMNAGARLARADVLLFLHADAELPRGALAAVADALADPGTLGGAFTIWFRGQGSPRSMPIIARGINARTRATSTATGDQAIFVRREFFERTNGYQPWPLFEDVELCTRIKGEGAFRILTGPVTISDRRYAKFGPWRTACLMWLLRVRYWMGTHPDELKKAFADVRPKKHSNNS